MKRISTALRRIKPRKNQLKIYNTGNTRSRWIAAGVVLVVLMLVSWRVGGG